MANDLKFEITFTSNGEPVIKNITGAIDGAKKAAEGAAATISKLSAVSFGGNSLKSEFDSAAGAAEEARQGMYGASAATEKLAGATRPLNQALNLLAPQLGLLGPAGNVAGNALLGLADGMTRTVAAGGLATVGIQAFANSINRATEESTQFGQALETGSAEFFRQNIVRLNAIASDRATDNIFQQIAHQVGALLGGDTDRLVVDLTAKINDYAAALKGIEANKAAEIARAFELQAQAVTALGPEKFAAQTAEAIEQLNVGFKAGKVSLEEYSAALAGVQSVGAANVELFNRGLREQIELLKAANDPLAQLEIRARNLGGGALANELLELQKNAARIQAGAPLVSQGFAAIGAAAVLPKSQLDALALSAFYLDKKFQAGTISAQQFTDAIKKVSTGALPDNQKVFVDKATGFGKELDALSRQEFPDAFQFQEIANKAAALGQAARAAFGTEIPSAVQTAIDRVKALTDLIAKEKGIGLKVDTLGVQVQFDTLRGQLGDLKKLGEDGFTVKADISQADRDIEAMISKIRELRAEAASIPLTLNAGVTSSPRRPFTEWFESYAPKLIAGLSDKSHALTFAATASGSPSMGFSQYFDSYAPGVLNNFAQSAPSLNFDASSLWNLAQRAFHTQPVAYLGQAYALNERQAMIDESNAARALLSYATGGAFFGSYLPASGAAPAAAPGGSMGAGVVVNIYLDGPITADTLDDVLIPTLTSAIIQATGTDPEIAIHN